MGEKEKKWLVAAALAGGAGLKSSSPSIHQQSRCH